MAEATPARPMIDRQAARSLVQSYIEKLEKKINAFGSALPGYAECPKSHLTIMDEHTQEHEFGWVFVYNTREYIVDHDHRHALAGNAPLIVDRSDGRLYVTGTAYPLEHYLIEYRQGKGVPAV